MDKNIQDFHFDVPFDVDPNLQKVSIIFAES